MKGKNLVRLAAAVVLIAIPFAVAGQQLKTRQLQPQQAAERVRLSSGPFTLPSGGALVDWYVLNDSTTSQNVSVTVFKIATQAAKTPVPPGTLAVTLAPGASTHNANSIGAGGPFQAVTYYEVVVESNSPDVLPIVNVLSSNGATVPGTLIPSGSWVRLQ